MKIKGAAVAVLALSVIIVAVSGIYFSVGLPILNALYNPLPETNNPGGNVVINKTNLLDFGDEFHQHLSTSDPDNSFIEPSPVDPGSTISEVTQIKASNLSFKSDSKNILLLGYNPDEGLCDSIFILNIDSRSHVMKLISIPRDTYVPYSADIKAAMKAKRYYYSPGAFKINASTYVGSSIISYPNGKFGNSGIDFMCDILAQMLPGCNIDEYVYVDFYGFMDIIDAVGGVTVTIPENMYKNTGELLLAKGKQKLNAKQALTYVRYRTRLDENGNNTNTGGDTFRKTNQISFLVEISSQIITTENMTFGKVTSMMDTLKKSVFHSFGDMSKVQDYLSIGVDFAKGGYSIEPYVVVGEEIDPLGDHASYVKLN